MIDRLTFAFAFTFAYGTRSEFSQVHPELWKFEVLNRRLTAVGAVDDGSGAIKSRMLAEVDGVRR